MAELVRYVNPDLGTDTPGNGNAAGASAWATKDYAFAQLVGQVSSGDNIVLRIDGAVADTTPALELGLGGLGITSLEIIYEASYLGDAPVNDYSIQPRSWDFLLILTNMKGDPVLDAGYTATLGFINVQLAAAGFDLQLNSGEGLVRVLDNGSSSGNYAVVHISEGDLINGKINNVRAVLAGSSGKSGGATVRGVYRSASGSVSVYNSAFRGFDVGCGSSSSTGIVPVGCLFPDCTDAVSAAFAGMADCYGDDSGGEAGLTNTANWALLVTDKDTDDYTPVSAGPLHNTGTDRSGVNGGVSVDAVGTSRPQGAAWDIGPIERTAAGVNVGWRGTLYQDDQSTPQASLTGITWNIRGAINDEATVDKGTGESTDASGVLELDFATATISTAYILSLSDGTRTGAWPITTIDLNA